MCRSLPSCKKANTCEDSVFGHRDISPSRHLAVHGDALTSNVLFESWTSPVAFLNALSSALIDAIPLKRSLSRETSAGFGPTRVGTTLGNPLAGTVLDSHAVEASHTWATEVRTTLGNHVAPFASLTQIRLLVFSGVIDVIGGV